MNWEDESEQDSGSEEDIGPGGVGPGSEENGNATG